LVQIVNKFIETYDGNVDVGFWNNIMTTEDRRIGSGGDVQTYLHGWITHFFQIYNKVDLDSIRNYKVCVPVKLINEWTKTTKNLTLYAAYTGIGYDKKYDAYRPQMSICLYHHPVTLVSPV
jgi:hypothetical protein